MIKHEIKNRWTGIAQFVAEIDCDEEAALSVKIGLAVRWGISNDADLCGANLCGANLRDADLFGANLRGADLCDADLCGANLSVLLTDRWTVYVHKEHIRIGCQYHTADEWFAFSDAQISDMASDALMWWNKWRPAILAIHNTIGG